MSPLLLLGQRIPCHAILRHLVRPTSQLASSSRKFSSHTTLEPIQKPQVKYTQLFINNEFVNSVSGSTFPTINPATGEQIATVQESNSSDVDRAVSAASEAFKLDSVWRTMDASYRGRLLYKLADLMERDLVYLASLEAYNNGKPFKLALQDVQVSIATCRFYAGAADKVSGQVLPTDGNLFAYTRYEPVGVCAAVTPWNYPIMMTVAKIAPCLAMGNTMVLKPAEQTPLTALVLASLLKEAGFPQGVFNVLPGFGPTAGKPLVEHALINKATFTGSTEVGKLIQKLAADGIKRVSLELGGKSPLIIMADADLDKAMRVASDLVMINQGQCCIAASRVYVHESIYDSFVKGSVELASKRKIGNPLDASVDHGPQIDEDQLGKIMGLIESGKKEGAKLEFGGSRVGSRGFFVQPTVFSDVTDNMRIAREEIFGPVQQILKFKDLDDVIERANATNYGLGAGVFTNNLNAALYVTSRLEAGQVYVNNYFNPSVQVPFGGYKQSGIGREFGLDGLRQYYEIKSVIVDLPFKI